MSDSDDEFPPALTPKKTTKKKPFVKDDLVWVHCGSTYWPAVVTHVTKKPAKVYVKKVNSTRKEKAFSVCAKRLFDFDDCQRNMKLLEQGKAKNPEIETAYDRVVRFCSKKLHDRNLSAVRFLTHDSNAPQTHQLHACPPNKKPQMWPRQACPGVDTKEAQNQFYGMTSDTDLSSISKCEEELLDVLKELRSDEKVKKNEMWEIESSDRLTKEELDARNEKARELLQVIESEDCWNHLSLIYKGTIYSKRHELYKSREKAKRDLLQELVGMSVFHDDILSEQLMSVVHGYFDKLEKRETFFRRYMYLVMVPEALMFAIRKVYGVDEDEAKKIFTETSGEIG